MRVLKTITIVCLAVLLIALSGCKSSGTPSPSGTTTCFPTIPGTTEPAAGNYQTIVDSMRSLVKGQKIPESFTSKDSGDFARTADAFDVNQYFTVLDHLSMETGYTLDYMYRKEYMGGNPFIYSRKTSDPPFTTSAEIQEFIEQGATSFSFLDHIRVDDTAEGFFQLVTLRTMAAQFYLWWHAGYNDKTIICDEKAANEIVSGLRSEYAPTAELLKQIPQLNYAPKIDIQKNSVNVKVVVFTKWGGILQEEYTINHQFPHTITNSEPKTLVAYDCGLRF